MLDGMRGKIMSEKKLNVPDKYQPYEGISITVKSDGIPLFACILAGIAILLWVISMVILSLQ